MFQFLAHSRKKLKFTCVQYQYDNLYRLTEATYSDGAYYAYDRVGNRLAYTDTLGEATGYDYDGANRLITVTKASVATPHSWSDRGELLSDGVQSYEWDAAGRLAGVSGPGGLEVGYGYNGTGQRVSRDSWAGKYQQPQTLNRFSYVTNNAVNFVDPTGHLSMPVSKRRDLLYQVGSQMATREGGDSLQKFIDLTNLAATLTMNNPRDFMLDTTCVILGYCSISTEVCTEWLWSIPFGGFFNDREAKKRWFLGQNAFKERGSWSDKYYDYTYNQMYHFWFYVAEGYFGSGPPLPNFGGPPLQVIKSPMWGYAGNLLHERAPWEPKMTLNCTKEICDWDPGQGGENDPIFLGLNKSQQDYDLGLRGVELGYALSRRSIQPLQVGQWMRNNLSQ